MKSWTRGAYSYQKIDISENLWLNRVNVHASAWQQSRYAQKVKQMPFDGGAVDATPTRRVAHFSYIDTEGKPRTDSYDVPVATTDAALNAFAAALGAISNASLWQVGYTNWFAAGTPSKANAQELTNDSVKDNLVILIKDFTNPNGIDIFVPANNEGASMVAGTENPDVTTAEMIALLAAIEGIWASYAPVSVRFSERKNKNRATKL